jgi:hypothetical protein
MQARAETLGEPGDWHALRSALRDLGRLLNFDPLTVEVHRASQPEPFSWITQPEQRRRWERARSLRLALDGQGAT